jgi:hypothetical protein
MDELWRLVSLSRALQDLLSLDGDLEFTVQLIDALVAQNGLGLLLTLLVQDRHVEPGLVSLRVQVARFDEALERVVWLGALGVQNPNADPIHIAVRVLVDRILEAPLTLRKAGLLEVAESEEVVQIPGLSHVVLDELQRLFKLLDSLFDTLLLVVRVAKILVHLEVLPSIHGYSLLVLFDSLVDVTLQLPATSDVDQNIDLSRRRYILNLV